MPGQARYIHNRTGKERKQTYIFFSPEENWEGTSKSGWMARRSHGMAVGRVAEVCCSIVAGVRWKKRFREVGDPWEVGAEADLRTSAED
jgi:hypothetical protein